jgi:hypothetical protein
MRLDKGAMNISKGVELHCMKTKRLNPLLVAQAISDTSSKQYKIRIRICVLH